MLKMSPKAVWLLAYFSVCAISHPLLLNNTDSVVTSRDDGLLVLPRLPAPPIAGSSKNPEASSLGSGDYEACGKRGTKLYADLIDDNNIQSSFQALESLEAWGWESTVSRQDPQFAPIMQQLREPFQNMQISGNDMQVVRDIHAQETKHGETYPPTHGQYDNVYFPSSGAILAWESFSPAHRRKENDPLPALQRWSDVAWLNWLRVNTVNGNLNVASAKNLRYIIQAPVVNKKTRDVVKDALKKSGVKSGVPGPYPGQMLRPSAKSKSKSGKGKIDPFEAVLGTENVSGSAYLLTQHRHVLGHKVVEGIQVWVQPGVKGAKDSPTYVIAVHVGDASTSKRHELESRSPVDRPVIAGSSKAAAATNVNNRFSYQSCAERGTRLYEMMMGKAPAPRTTFTDYGDLRDWGWRIETKSSDLDVRAILDQIRGPLRALGITGTGAQVRKATHARATEHDGGQYEPTGGHYFDVYYPNDGTILAWDNESPEHMSLQPEKQWNGKPLPDLQRFSDVVFLNWDNVVGSEHVTTLKYVIRYPVNNANTQEVIRQALVNNGVNSGEPGAWPGHTLKYKAKGLVGRKSNAFEAVLGTENVNGIVYLLRQHQAFEEDIITSIQVWRQAGGKSGGLGIVVHIGRSTTKRAADEANTSSDISSEVQSISERSNLNIDEGYWSDDGGGEHTAVQRRAPPAGPSGPSKEYIQSVQKGHQLYLRMIQDKSVRKDNPLSRFSLYSDLATHGWTVNTGTFNPEQIGAVEKASDAKGLRWQDRSRNHVVVATHSGTNARYVNIFNPSQGAIYAFDNRSPNYEKNKPGSSVSKDIKVPKLQHYSDVTYLTWAKSTTSETRRNLKYFFSVQVLNPAGKAIINEALRLSGKRLDVWPGHQFTPANMNPFLAVMATGNVQRVAYMLAQHRGEQQLGDKVIASITVWRPLEGAESSDPTPAIMVEIQDRAGASGSGT